MIHGFVVLLDGNCFSTIQRKQSTEESFETHAENMFELFEEYSGIEGVIHKSVILPEFLLTTAGPHVHCPTKAKYLNLLECGTEKNDF